MRAARGERRGGVLEPTVLAMACVLILCGLGIWQVQRGEWKAQLIQTLNVRLAAKPEALPSRDRWARLNARADEYRRVVLPVEFLLDQEALVYVVSSSFRPDVRGPGYWVFTPARLFGGSVVVINRGFVPLDRKDPSTRKDDTPPGIVEVVGIMRWPEERGMFTPVDEPQNNLWHVRDANAMAAAKGWGPVAPFYIDMEAPQPAGGLPSVAPLQVKLPDNHLGYALTWFGLAATLVGVYFFWLIGRFRRG